MCLFVLINAIFWPFIYTYISTFSLLGKLLTLGLYSLQQLSQIRMLTSDPGIATFEVHQFDPPLPEKQAQ